MGNLSVNDAGYAAQVVVNTHINDTQVEAVLAAEHVDTAAAKGKVHHLLPCYLTGRYTYTFALYAVVAAKQQMARVGCAGSQRLLDKAQLHSEFFQAPQRSLGFVQVVNLLLDGFLE
jgi:hypothetical protein